MNELYVKIKMAQKQYRVAAIKEKNHRAKVKASILSTLMGDIDTKTKRGDNVSTSDVIKMVKKYISDIEATMKARPCADLEAEKEALHVYIPRQMSELELTVAINDAISEIENPTMSDMGRVMSSVKCKHEGLYDGKKASSMVREILSK